MKKLMIMALMAFTASFAFAQEDVVKQILKLKDYNEAASLLKSNLNSMNAEQKAKCYNKLVDLAMEKVAEGQTIMAANEMAKQAGKAVQPIDEADFYTAVANAIEAGSECDKYDKMPNEKGKVKAKFHQSNQERLYGQRLNLINGGIYFQEKNDIQNAYKFLAGYVDSADDPLFAEIDKSQDNNLTNIAYFAAIYAYQNKETDKVDKYATIAMADPEKGKDALNLKLAVAQQNLKTHEDSVAYVKNLEQIYAADKSNDVIYETLVLMYSQMNMKDELEKAFNEKLATDPNNFTVWAIRGQNAMVAQNLEEAIGHFRKALVSMPDNPQVLTWLGACLLDRATQAEDRAAGKSGRVSAAAESQIKPIFEEAQVHLEKAKQLDPNREKSKWAYPLYRCYYRLYGAEDQRTKDAEAFTK